MRRSGWLPRRQRSITVLRLPIAFTALCLLACGAQTAQQQRPLRAPLSAPAPSSRQAPSVPRATATPLPVPASASELQALELRERVGAYAARSAAWIPSQPIAVNRDFDFATALGTDSGAGIAAALRRDKNAALAEQLGQLEAIEPVAAMAHACAQERAACAELAPTGVRIYGLLYGEKTARLRVLLELREATPVRPIYSSISAAAPVETFAERGALANAFAQELARALALSTRARTSPSALAGRCAAGDGASVHGQVVEDDGTRVVLLVQAPRPMLVSCAVGSFTPLGPQTATRE